MSNAYLALSNTDATDSNTSLQYFNADVHFPNTGMHFSNTCATVINTSETEIPLSRMVFCNFGWSCGETILVIIIRCAIPTLRDRVRLQPGKEITRQNGFVGLASRRKYRRSCPTTPLLHYSTTPLLLYYSTFFRLPFYFLRHSLPCKWFSSHYQ